MQKITRMCWFGIILCCLTACREDKETISLFPLEHYSQRISDWIKPTNADYDKPMMSLATQQKHIANLYEHTYGALSPWNAEHVEHLLNRTSPDDIKTVEESLIHLFSNENKSETSIGYGENFRPHPPAWIDSIAYNIDAVQFNGLHFNSANEGIAVDNLPARALPTNDVDFYSYKLAGEGYPFDNLQMSALWVGTPVYILGHTRDDAWTMVLTPDYIAWVNTRGIARVSAAFIDQWRIAAKKQLVAITHTQTSIFDSDHHFQFSAYVGSFFPLVEKNQDYKVMIPVADNKQQAVIQYSIISRTHAALIPLPVTQHNFSRLISTLIGRPYGWGNLYFYNDCSSELKSLFTPFGIWLPRHSSDQVSIGKLIDLTAHSTEERINYLKDNGRAFMTLVYVGGHIILYIGNYPNPNVNSHALMVMTYQNMWGLSPKPPIRRAIIGQSVLFPMLVRYPEDPSLMSQAGKAVFQVSFLNEIPGYLIQLEVLDLKSLMYPD